MHITQSEAVFFLVTLSLTLLILTVFFLLLIGLFNKSMRKKQTELFMSILETQETERQRIGKDLHDDIAPLLASIKINLERVTPNKTDREIIDYVYSLLNDAIHGIRSSAHNLMPQVLYNRGLITAIQEICNNFNSSNLSIHFNHRTAGLTITPIALLNIYRVIQEAINNSLKYSQARNLYILLIQNRHTLVLRISDDGIGFNTDQFHEKANGIGLKNIESRIRLLNGSYALKSKEGKGTSILISLSMKDISHAQ